MVVQTLKLWTTLKHKEQRSEQEALAKMNDREHRKMHQLPETLFWVTSRHTYIDLCFSISLAKRSRNPCRKFRVDSMVIEKLLSISPSL